MRIDIYFKGMLLTLIGGIFWGFSGACGQYLFVYKNIDPKWLVSIRLLSAGIFIISVLFIKKRKEIFIIFHSKKSLVHLFIYAVFGLMLCQYTYFEAIKYSNAAIATVLQYTAPAMIMLLICIYKKRFPLTKEIFALFCAITGVFLLATHGDISNLAISKKALIIGLVSALCVVVYSISPMHINKKYGTMNCLGLGLVIGGLTVAFMTKFWNLNGIDDMDGFFALCGVVILGTIFAFSFYMFGLNIIGPARASLIASIEPISAALFTHFWFDVKFIYLDYIGFFLILTCTLLLAKK